ncbi:MAG: MotA/TolQ/ExbB proton channel family protein [Coprococcus catus]|nr:MotA/TolQ/ExbB proton channel family protein [Coprococcus catus]
MKKLGNKNILYAVWIILCAATAFLGGFGHSMLINYAFLAVMGLLILIVDRHGLSKICRITKDLKGITETFSEAEAQGTQGNEAYLSLMESMHFTYPETEGDWMRLQESWKSSDGMDCDVEDYIFESELLESCNYNVCTQVAGILTALGILGTFLGLVLGLRSFDFSNADQMTSSVEALVGGLNVAFYTSIYGVTLSILYNIIFRRITTGLTQELNHFYDAFNSALEPVSQKAMVERMDSRQAENNALMQDIKALLDERLGERLGHQMAETLTPVFDRIIQSLDSMMLDFHKEQANSLEKMVDAFVDRMGGALNSHVKALGESVDELSQAQKTMSVELQRLIKQIVKTSKDTSQINEHAGIILEQLSGYIPLLTQTSQDSAKVIENMVKWSEDIQKMTDTQHLAMEKMTVEQNDLLKVMAEHEGNLDQTCEEISANQQQLSESLTEFTKAAQIIAEREEDPLQLDGIKDMLSGYMTTMQKLQQESAQNIENIQSAGIREMLTYVSAQTEANAKESQAVQQKLTEELQKLAKTQEDIVFLNAKIANTLSSLTGTGKIQLPSKGLQQDEEKWSKVLNEKMDAWIREQKAFQERLLQLEEERSQPFWSRWGRK